MILKFKKKDFKEIIQKANIKETKIIEEKTESLPKHIFSDKFHSDMEELLEANKSNNYSSHKKVAVVCALLFVVLCVSISILWFKDPTPRAPADSEISLVGDTMVLYSPVLPTEKYTKTNVSFENGSCCIHYTSTDNKSFSFTQKKSYNYDLEVVNAEELQIDDIKAFYYTLNDQNILIWDYNDYTFKIEGKIKKEEMTKMTKLEKYQE